MRADLDRYFEEREGCTVLRDDGRKTLLRCEGPARTLFVKIYRHTGVLTRLPVLSVLSPGMRQYRTSRRLRSAGIDVPEAVGAAVWKGPGGQIDRSLFATLWIADMFPLKEYAVLRNGSPSLIGSALHELNRALGRQIAILHENGIKPHDVNSGNFLVRPRGTGGFDIMLVDLEGIRFACRVSEKRRIANLAQLAACMLPLTGSAAEEICAGYAAVIPSRGTPGFLCSVHDRARSILSQWENNLNASFDQVSAARRKAGTEVQGS